MLLVQVSDLHPDGSAERWDRAARVLDHVAGLVLTGHAHTAAASTFAGRPPVVAPGVVSTLRFPAELAGDLDHDLPPAVALHYLAERTLTTHFGVVPVPDRANIR